MRTLRKKVARDDGWTFIEATLAIVVISVMVLGLTIVLMAFREHLDRSWAVRVMDQYGNDVIEQLTHELRNATDISVRPGPRDTHKIEITLLDPILHDVFHRTVWEMDRSNPRILTNRRPVDPFFPPSDPGRGEYYEIVSFRLTQYGEETPNLWEERDRNRRNADFLSAAWDIRFKLRYNRGAVTGGVPTWSYEKEYYNRVYLRNKNLIVKQGGFTG